MTPPTDEPFAEALLAQTRWLRSLVGELVDDTAMVDDVCQSTMLRAWQSRPTLERSLRPWLARVALNLTRQLGWRERQRGVRESRAAKRDLAPAAAEVVECVAWQQTIVGFVMALDEPYRSTILLRFFESAQPREVARRMGVPVETVRTRIKRGLAILRDRLDRHTGDRRAWVAALVPLGGAAPIAQATALLMTKKIVSLAAILVAGLAIGYLTWDPGPSPLAPDVPLSAGRSDGAARTPDGGTPVDANAPSREIVASATGETENPLAADPKIAAALCGFRGRIVGSSGESVPGCVVRIHRFSFDGLAAPGVGLLGDRGRGPGITSRSGTTGADGRFFVRGIWPRGMYVLVGDHRDYGRLLRLVDEVPAPGEIVDLGDLRIVADAVITGTVTDERGEPVEDARVRATDLPKDVFALAPFERFEPNGAILIRDGAIPVSPVISIPAWLRELYGELPIATTRTDSSGRFRLTGVMPGENVVLVDRAPRMPAVKTDFEVRAGQSHDAGTIRLHDGERLVGHVVDADGDVVSGANVLVAPTSRNGPVDVAVMVGPTDAKGRFEYGGLPSGRVTIAVRRSEAHEWYLAAPQPVSDELVVRLPKLCTLSVVVRSRVQRRVEEIELEVLRGEIGRQSISFRTVGLQDPVDLDGRVRRHSAEAWVVSDLEPGSYVLAVACPGHARMLRSVVLPAQSPVEFLLEEKQTHDVRVVDGTGAPVRLAEVFAEPNSSRDLIDAPLPINCGRTDADGRLRIDGVNHPQLRVTAMHPAYGMAAVVVPRAERDVVVRLDRPGAIHGRLVENGEPPSLGRYSIRFHLLEAPDHGAIERSSSVVAVDRDGRFTIAGLQPGRYIVGAIPALRAADSLGDLVGLIATLDQDPVASTAVEVRADRRAEAILRIGTAKPSASRIAKLTGVVLLNGAAHSGMRVRLRGSDGVDVVDTRTDSAGRFDSGAVPTGRYRVSVYAPEDSEHTLHVRYHELFSGDSEHWIVQVATASIGGQVVDSAGRPVARVPVDIFRASTDGPGVLQFRAYADRKGRFEKTLLPEGPYRVRATSRRPVGTTQEERFELAAGQSRNDLRLEVGVGLELSGRVDRRAHGLQGVGSLTLRLFRLEPLSGGQAALMLVAKTKVRKDDGFTFTGLTRGEYQIRIETGAGDHLVHRGSIQIGDAGLKTLELNPGPVK